MAQSVRLHAAPPFGSLVRVPYDDRELYAVVAETRTASLEAGGRPIARGYGAVVDAAIYHENPDLEHVLRTEFRALLVGFRTEGTLRQHLRRRRHRSTTRCMLAARPRSGPLPSGSSFCGHCSRRPRQWPTS